MADGAFADVPTDPVTLESWMLWAELAAALGDRRAAGILLPRLEPLREDVVTEALGTYGVVSRCVGALTRHLHFHLSHVLIHRLAVFAKLAYFVIELAALLLRNKLQRPNDPGLLGFFQDAAADEVIALLTFKVLFNHENRIRALEGKPPLTPAQARAAIKALM